MTYPQNGDAGLVRYEAVCQSVAELRTVDETKTFRDKAEALRVFARQTNNRGLEIDASEIRIRSERRLGELLTEQKATVGFAPAGRPKIIGSDEEPIIRPATLADIGIDKKLSMRSQRLAAVDSEDFEREMSEWRWRSESEQARVSLDILKRNAKAEKTQERRDEVDTNGCKVEDLNLLINAGRKFGCIYADPPWLYDNQGTRAATSNHYDGLTVDELCALPIGDLAATDAHLHLWTTNGFLFECDRIIKAWGFEFRSSFIWVKPQIGIGNYWRNSHEILLTAIRGNAKRFADKSLKSWLECDRGAHSAKPEIVRHMIEKASPGPFLELFARSPADGWTVWGNQIESGLLHQHIGEFAA